MTSITTFRRVAIAEAISFLVLLVAAFVKRVNDVPEGVSVMGPIHGLLFIAYVLIALNLRQPEAWSTRTSALVLLGAVVPLGGFAVDRWLAGSGPRAGVNVDRSG